MHEHHSTTSRRTLTHDSPLWSWSLPEVITPSPLAEVDLPLPLRSLLQRRGIRTVEEAEHLLDPPDLPDPEQEFPDLATAAARLARACRGGESLAICGDYDADGMTSTALLIRALRPLGADAVAAIPSRMDDGYGLNTGMVERLQAQGIRLLVTVDNGVAAVAALEKAIELDVEVIVTDHHTIPAQRPPMAALIHPATTPESSPYRGLAGVGLAYVLAEAVASRLKRPEAVATARDLFCIGTVADMAPLTGANRRWLRDGLRQLHRSRCEGLQALQRLSGLGDRPLRSDDIGFQIAPRINAVGRLGEPSLVVDLLTVEDAEAAMALARRCDDYNRQRRDLCNAIEAEAVALVEADRGTVPPFLLLAQGHWHHGVIGIVAARLVERYHRPAALLAGEGDGRLRASVRAPSGFAVDAALNSCSDLLERFGGHPAAGGFTVAAEQVHPLQERLNSLAEDWLSRQGQGIPIRPDALLSLEQVNWDLWSALQRLEPFGIGHETPLFWSRDCRVTESRTMNGGHLALKLSQGSAERRAVAWRWSDQRSVPSRCDVAFRINLNRWQGEQRLQLDVKALRPHSDSITLCRGTNRYTAARNGEGLTLSNDQGRSIEARVPAEEPLNCRDPLAQNGQVLHLLEEASLALGLRP